MARTHQWDDVCYSDSFKAEAVRLASQAGIRGQKRSQPLDIRLPMLLRWRKPFREGVIMAQPPQQASPELVMRLREYIDCFYNSVRLHSASGDLTPIALEAAGNSRANFLRARS